MGVIAVFAKRMNLPYGDALPPLSQALRLLGRASPALVLPPLTLLVIFTGVATPTEAAVVAAAFSFVLGYFVYGELTWNSTVEVLWDSARQTAQVMFIIALSAPFAWVLIQQQIPNGILASLLSLSSERWVILLIINFALLVLGMFIEGIAIMIIAYPVLLPIVTQIGLDPVHFGVVLVLNIMIGLVTPPVGLCLYVVAGIAKLSVAEITREVWPYVLALISVLLVITFVPAISLWLPNLLGYGVTP